MTATITPVPKHTGATITRPVAGEKAGMDTGPAPLAGILQTLADRAQYARGATWGLMVGGKVFAVAAGGSNTVFAVSLSAFEAMVAKDTDGVFWPRFTTADTTFALADVESTPANLANSTWYYCYLGVNTDGSLRKQISTTGPGASGVWKSGAADLWRFVGAFPTDGSGNPLPLRRVGQKVLYQRSAIADASILRVLNGGSSTSVVTRSCAAVVPPHARVATVRARVSRSGAAGLLSIATVGDSSGYQYFGVGTAGGLDESQADVLLDASQQFDYFVDNASTSATIWVVGWEDNIG